MAIPYSTATRKALPSGPPEYTLAALPPEPIVGVVGALQTPLGNYKECILQVLKETPLGNYKPCGI